MVSIRAVALASLVALAVAACGTVVATPPTTGSPSSDAPRASIPLSTPASTPTPTTPTAAPTSRPTLAPTPKPTATLPTTGDAGLAITLLDRYEKALVASQWQTAWQMLAPAYQASRGSLAAYAEEREAFFRSAGTTYVLGKPTNDRVFLAQWLPSNTGSLGADLSRAYVLEVTYPALAGNNAGIEVFLVGPTTSGIWAIWGLR